jgi:hypothetical protein
VTNTGNLTIGSVTAFSTTVTGVTGGGHAIITALSSLTVANRRDDGRQRAADGHRQRQTGG